MRGKRRKLNLPREGYFCPVAKVPVGPGPSHPAPKPRHLKENYWELTPEDLEDARRRRAEERAAEEAKVQRDLERLNRRLIREGKAGIHGVSISSTV